MAEQYRKPARFGPRRPNYVRQWREAANLSQDDLADAMEVSKSTVHRVETGAQGYSQDFIEVAAEVLHCDPIDLITRPPPVSAADVWRQKWDDLRDQLRASEREQALRHISAIITSRRNNQTH